MQYRSVDQTWTGVDTLPVYTTHAQPGLTQCRRCESITALAPSEWMFRQYRGHLLKEVEPVPISVTGYATVFTVSHNNTSHDVRRLIWQKLPV